MSRSMENKLEKSEEERAPLDCNQLYEFLLMALEDGAGMQDADVTLRDAIEVLTRILAVKYVGTNTERYVHDNKIDMTRYVGQAFVGHVKTQLDLKRLIAQDDKNERQ